MARAVKRSGPPGAPANITQDSGPLRDRHRATPRCLGASGCPSRSPADHYGSCMRLVLRVAAAMAGLAGFYIGLVRGALTLDLGIGRRVMPLGPLRVRVSARERLSSM